MPITIDEIVALLDPTVKTFKFQLKEVIDPKLPASGKAPPFVLSKATVAA